MTQMCFRLPPSSDIWRLKLVTDLTLRKCFPNKHTEIRVMQIGLIPFVNLKFHKLKELCFQCIILFSLESPEPRNKFFRPLSDTKDYLIKFSNLELEWNPESWGYSPKFMLLISSKDRTCIQIFHTIYRTPEKCFSGRSDNNSTLRAIWTNSPPEDNQKIWKTSPRRYLKANQDKI